MVASGESLTPFRCFTKRARRRVRRVPLRRVPRRGRHGQAGGATGLSSTRTSRAHPARTRTTVCVERSSDHRSRSHPRSPHAGDHGGRRLSPSGAAGLFRRSDTIGSITISDGEARSPDLEPDQVGRWACRMRASAVAEAPAVGAAILAGLAGGAKTAKTAAASQRSARRLWSQSHSPRPRVYEGPLATVGGCALATHVFRPPHCWTLATLNRGRSTRAPSSRVRPIRRERPCGRLRQAQSGEVSAISRWRPHPAREA